MIIGHKSNAREAGAAPHREGGIHFIYLLDGREGAQDNYSLSLFDSEDEYATPRHRHNFEQVRVMLEGEFSFGPGSIQPEGWISYFCEGCYYTQKGVGHSRTLLLQVAGPSGEGYMSHDVLRRGGAELAKKGQFGKGVYTWLDQAGRKNNKDGYEAVWEHVQGRTIRYALPRYAEPILINPAAFTYLPVDGRPGVEARTFGVFNERGLTIRQIRMAAGSEVEIGDDERGWIWFADAGEGRAGGERWGPHSAIDVARGERVRLTAESEAEFFIFGLPSFPDPDPQLSARPAA